MYASLVNLFPFLCLFLFFRLTLELLDRAAVIQEIWFTALTEIPYLLAQNLFYLDKSRIKGIKFVLAYVPIAN